MKPFVKNYLFRWLYKTENFDLGHNISDSDYLENNNSLSDMILEFKTKRKFISKKTYDYYKNNHSLEYIADKLLDFSQNSKLSIKHINPNLLKKSLLRKLYERKKYGL